jgi:spore coat protein A
VEGNPLVRIVPHLHGGHVPAQFDGNPLHWMTPDPAAPANGLGGPAGNSIEYTYPNDQPASTIWFHDHALGVTRLNVYAGLAAFYLVRDAAEDALGLPSGKYEIPLVLQDKSFNDDGSLAYKTLPIMNPYAGMQMLDADGNRRSPSSSG